jgi:hypothetical protein
MDIIFSSAFYNIQLYKNIDDKDTWKNLSEEIEEDIFFDASDELPSSIDDQNSTINSLSPPNSMLYRDLESNIYPHSFFFNFLKAFIPSDPHAQYEDDDDSTNPKTLSEIGIADLFSDPFTPTEDGLTAFEKYISDPANIVINTTKKLGAISYKALQNPTIQKYVIYTASSNAGNYIINSCATEAILEKLGPLALPITAAALVGLSYTSLPNKVAQKVGVSKKTLVLGGAALVALQTSVFVDPSYFATLPIIALKGAIKTGLQTAITKISENNHISFEENFSILATNNTILGIAQAIVPTSSIVAAGLGYTALYGKTIVEITGQVSAFKAKLETNDIGDIAQELAIASVENPSTLISTVLHQVGRFTRAGIRGFSDYMDVIANSDRIHGAQSYFVNIYLDANSTATQRNTAKNHLIATIKNVIRNHCTATQTLVANLANQFDASFEEALNSIDIESLEKSIVKLSLTNNEAKKAYTKDLIGIHIRCLVAFSALNVTNNTPLSHDEQARFIHNVTGIALNHYQIINPDSLAIKAANAILPTAVDIGTDFLFPNSVHSETPLETEIVSSSEPLEENSITLNLLNTSMRFVFSFFSAFFNYIHSKLSNAPYSMSEEIEASLLNSIFISNSESIEFETEEDSFRSTPQ